MARGTAERREALRERIVDVAEARVTEGGAGALKAREIAAEAGCAVGALYNAIGDRHAILAAVNLRTFAMLGAAVMERVAGAPETGTARLEAMALAYRDFAGAHAHRWRALFDASLTQKERVQPGYRDELIGVLGLIEGELARLRPDLEARALSDLGRLLFSSVHGTVALSLEGRMSALPAERLDTMLPLLVRNVASRT